MMHTEIFGPLSFPLPGAFFFSSSSRHRNLSRTRLSSSLLWMSCLFLILFLRRGDSSTHNANPMAKVSSILLATGYDLSTGDSSSYQSISEHRSTAADPSSPRHYSTPSDDPSSVTNDSNDEDEDQREESFSSFLSTSYSQGLRAQAGLIPSPPPPAPAILSPPATPRSLSLSPLATPVAIPHTWATWMGSGDRRGRNELSGYVQGVAGFGTRGSADRGAVTLIEEAVPEGTLMNIRILSSDGSRIQGPIGGQGASSDADVLLLRRGPVLGSGTQSVTVGGDFVEPAGSPASDGEESEEEARSEGSGQKSSSRGNRRRRGPCHSRTVRQASAVTFVVTKQVGPPKPSWGKFPLSNPRELQDHVVRLQGVQARLVEIARRHGGSDVLMNTYGMVLPRIIGKLEGYPEGMHKLGTGRRRRHLLNVVTVLPRLSGSLLMLHDRSRRMTPLARVYVVKALIRLAGHLSLLDLVHRDLSLASILLDDLGRMYFSGFQYVKHKDETYLCKDVVSAHLVEPYLAVCKLRFPEHPVTAHRSSDAWMLGMILFTWMCHELPFSGMIYDMMHEDSRAQINTQVLAALYDPSIASTENRNRSYPAPVDWNRCVEIDMGQFPLVKDAIQGLLDMNPETRSKPYDMITTHPLFLAEQP
ncbi:rhoptry kinase family protein rop11 (incomplete catalytic triad) [Cystoisospora suis]|uniref:Rhoptry kinase family protein rop11 (Incomplete catalytic triad) n=1 Tax=Cystoisospora suis TaxID=483139 RepID=A0A2C6KWG5_9APIC|nr:rhoptry kinase family protein rop11 (incomplete catalytic triad) [Cystoisospora suis]